MVATLKYILVPGSEKCEQHRPGEYVATVTACCGGKERSGQGVGSTPLLAYTAAVQGATNEKFAVRRCIRELGKPVSVEIEMRGGKGRVSTGEAGEGNIPGAIINALNRMYIASDQRTNQSWHFGRWGMEEE